MSSGSRLESSAATPIRELDGELVDGCRLLAGDTAQYRDGAEERVTEILSQARDLSSWSDELTGQADSWSTLYSLSSARANLLRPLSLDRGMAVLDIGAGCGGLTRYLGESCAIVDTLEPMLARARAARARTRDLPGVEVFVGDIRSVPRRAAYDLVTAVGVLEYIARGEPDPAPYVAFLTAAAALLKPGGTLAIAIENRVGVKYLAGAAEDHTGRRFDALEGYPDGAPARIFSRLELDQMLRAAGLLPTFIGAFPDYKLTRTMVADELFQVDPELAVGLLTSPSPDWGGPVTRSIDELALWRTMVEAGMGPQVSNSFLVLASSSGQSRLWPKGRLAASYQNSRRAFFAVQTLLERSDGATLFARSFVSPHPSGSDASASTRSHPGSGIHLALADSVRVPGRSLLEVLARSSGEELAHWLDAWRAALDDLLVAVPAPALIDALPHNFLVGPDGTPRLVDSKWRIDGATRSDILDRCALVTGQLLGDRRLPAHWAAPTREGIVRRLATLLGRQGDGAWLEEALSREARFQALVASVTPDRPEPRAREEIARQNLHGGLSQIPGPPDLEALRITQLATSLGLERSLNRDLQNSTSWRFTAPLRDMADRARRWRRTPRSAESR